MTRYINAKVNISEGQKEKLQHAIKAHCSAVSIRLGHEDLRGNDILAITAKLDTIASHVSKTLTDDFISDEEFRLIMEELNKYKAMKEEIRNNTKKKLKEEEKESLIERGRQEGRESFRRLVEKNNTGG